MATEIKVDLSDFLKSSARLRAQLGEKGGDAETFMRARAKATIKTMITRTPPGTPKVSGKYAKNLGLNKIASDAAKAVMPTTPSRAESTDVRGIIDSLRNSRGRVRKPAKQITVPLAALNAEIKRRQAEVGKLAAGFNAAAAKLGYKPPAWIWRHSSPGSIEIKVSKRGIKIVIINAVEFASRVEFLEKRIQAAVDEEARKNNRQLKYLVSNAAKKSGFK